VSASRITRELWWTSQEFSPADIIIITIALQAHISPGGWTIGSLLAAVLRSKSRPFDMITQSINAWKNYWDFIEPRRTHSAYMALCLSAFLHTHVVFSEIFKYVH
jgi:hypothetical protein